MVEGKIVWRWIDRLKFGSKLCGNSPSLEESKFHNTIMEFIRSLIHGQQQELSVALQDTLINCNSRRKGRSQPCHNREQNQEFGNRI